MRHAKPLVLTALLVFGTSVAATQARAEGNIGGGVSLAPKTSANGPDGNAPGASAGASAYGSADIGAGTKPKRASGKASGNARAGEKAKTGS